MLKIVTLSSTISDFIVQNLENVKLQIIDHVSYDRQHAFAHELNDFTGGDQNGTILNQFMKTKRIDYELRSNGCSIYIYDKPYLCPVCQNEHDSNNLGYFANKYTIYCYSSKKRLQIFNPEQNKLEEVKESEEPKKMTPKDYID